MGLSRDEQQELDSIEHGLVAADPTLAGLLTTFTRLAAGEEMPAREAIPPARRRWQHSGRHSGRHSAGRTGRLAATGHLTTLLWLTTAVALIAVALLLSGRRGKGEACSRLPVVACIWQAPGHAVGAAARSPGASG